jgi:tRNA (guanine-N7-)-methyltransferase
MILSPIKSFVRRGRISDAQERAYKAGADGGFTLSDDGPPLALDAVFGNAAPVTCEIGFGMGESTALLAAANSDKNYIGIEVYKAGIGKLLWEIEQRGLTNIRIIEGNAPDVINKRITDGALAAFHIFFPDPWPKKKHHKRRLIQRPFTDLLAQKLMPGGYIAFATDDADYAESAREALTATPGLVASAGASAWRPETKFERRAREAGRAVVELFFTVCA